VTGLTHDGLVEVARKWLLKKSTGRMACSLVVTDMTTSESETPDALGWTSAYSIMVECKVSRSDFLADKRKYFRRKPDMGVGDLRYMMTPVGLIKTDELPDGWGLVEVNEKGKPRVKHRHGPTYIESNQKAEKCMLLSLIRRLDVEHGDHVNIRAYQFKTATTPRATVTIADGGAS